MHPTIVVNEFEKNLFVSESWYIFYDSDIYINK